MNVPPPPKPRRRFTALFVVVGVVVLVVVVSGAFAVHYVLKSGITTGMDNMFGDQHLKTAVALIELHKTRFGKYPQELSELKFTGQWDQIALQNVRYYPNAEGTAYYIEVARGWVGKPDFEMPAEFWRGTGYTTALKPANP